MGAETWGLFWTIVVMGAIVSSFFKKNNNTKDDCNEHER